MALKDVGNKGLDVTGDQYNKLVDILLSLIHI